MTPTNRTWQIFPTSSKIRRTTANVHGSSSESEIFDWRRTSNVAPGQTRTPTKDGRWHAMGPRRTCNDAEASANSPRNSSPDYSADCSPWLSPQSTDNKPTVCSQKLFPTDIGTGVRNLYSATSRIQQLQQHFCVTYRAGVQPIGRRLSSRPRTFTCNETAMHSPGLPFNCLPPSW